MRAEPRIYPRGEFDDPRAWDGAWPGRPDLPVRVEAAALGGRLVWLDSEIDGIRSGAVMTPRIGTAGMNLLTAVIYVVLPLIAAVLAWRNHRVRRTDARGAALFFAVVLVGREIHASARMLTYVRVSLGMALYTSTVAWIYYLAVEPIVRRWWPDVLIGWSRLSATRRLDARLGREVLVGLTVGAFAATVRAANPLLSSVIGWEMPVSAPSRFLNGGATQILAAALHEVSDGFLYGMIFLFIAAISRQSLRRAWPLGAGPLVFALIAWLDSESLANPATLATAAICAVVVLVLISRVGLLAAFACTGCYVLLERDRTTLNPEIWSFEARLLVLAALCAVGVHALRRALPRRPLGSGSLAA